MPQKIQACSLHNDNDRDNDTNKNDNEIVPV